MADWLTALKTGSAAHRGETAVRADAQKMLMEILKEQQKYGWEREKAGLEHERAGWPYLYPKAEAISPLDRAQADFINKLMAGQVGRGLEYLPPGVKRREPAPSPYTSIEDMTAATPKGMELETFTTKVYNDITYYIPKWKRPTPKLPMPKSQWDKNEAVIKRYEEEDLPSDQKEALAPRYVRALKENYDITLPPKPAKSSWRGFLEWVTPWAIAGEKKKGKIPVETPTKTSVTRKQNIIDLRRLKAEGRITTRQEAIEALKRVGAVTGTDVRGYEEILKEFPWGR